MYCTQKVNTTKQALQSAATKRPQQACCGADRIQAYVRHRTRMSSADGLYLFGNYQKLHIRHNSLMNTDKIAGHWKGTT